MDFYLKIHWESNTDLPVDGEVVLYRQGKTISMGVFDWNTNRIKISKSKSIGISTVDFWAYAQPMLDLKEENK